MFRPRDILATGSGDPELAQAQLSAFTKQVPLLYFMLVTNTVSLTVTRPGIPDAVYPRRALCDQRVSADPLVVQPPSHLYA
jgi:hypothetical protein